METPAVPPPLMLDREQPCVKCGYQLKGLQLSGVCPECGTPVQDSLRGFLLQHAAEEYRRAVQQGLSIILNAILLMVLLTVGAIIVQFSLGQGQGVTLAIQMAMLAVGLASIYGYWRYTEPDPGYTGIEKPNSARQVIRIAAAVNAVVQLLNVVVTLAFPMVPAGGLGGGPAGVTAAVVLVLLVGLLGLVAWCVQFFAVMRYTRWMASRVPDGLIEKRTGTYLWLLPVLYVVGALACGIGPLIALVLYWNLLDRLRKHVKSINQTGLPAKV